MKFDAFRLCLSHVFHAKSTVQRLLVPQADCSHHSLPLPLNMARSLWRLPSSFVSMGRMGKICLNHRMEKATRFDLPRSTVTHQQWDAVS